MPRDVQDVVVRCKVLAWRQMIPRGQAVGSEVPIGQGADLAYRPRRSDGDGEGL
jgi:hypothetical protein